MRPTKAKTPGESRIKKVPLPVLGVILLLAGIALGEIFFSFSSSSQVSDEASLKENASLKITKTAKPLPSKSNLRSSSSAPPTKTGKSGGGPNQPSSSSSSSGTTTPLLPSRPSLPVGRTAPTHPEKLQLGPLPRPAWSKLAKDPLKCSCGSVPCHQLDHPTTSYVLVDFTSVRRVEEIFTKISSLEGVVEVMVAGGAMDPAALKNASQRVFAARSHRQEPLEQVSLVYTNPSTPRDEVVGGLVRMSSGASVAVVSGHSSVTTVDKDTGLDLQGMLHDLSTVEAEELSGEDELAVGSEVVLPASLSRDQVLASVFHPTSLKPQASNATSPPAARVSFLLQYFKRASLVTQIGKILSGYNMEKEVLIHDDSASEHHEWIAALNSTRYWVVHSGNLHEVRGYNRLARLANNDLLVLLQDDDLPPPEPAFVAQGHSLFNRHPLLALIGGLTGQIQGGPATGRYGKQRARHVRQIPHSDSSGAPFMFVSWVNMGPFIMRRSVFLKVGSFLEEFACRGDPGIGFDYEYGLRLWQHGYQVGLTIQGFRYHVGKTRTGGTRSSDSMKNRRDMLESRNSAYILNLYRGFYVNHAPEGANRSPRAKAMPLAKVCKAAVLPTLANRALVAANRRG